MSNSVRSAASSSPTTQIPASRSRASVAGRPATRAIGTCSIAPADALATVGVTWTARWRGTSTPSTPAPSQLRMIAPRLPGSVTPSMATRNGGRPGRPRISSPSSASGSAAANAMTPCGASLRARASSFVAGDVGDRAPGWRWPGRRCRRRRRRACRRGRSARSRARSRGPCGARRSAARGRPGGPRPARRRGPWRPGPDAGRRRRGGPAPVRPAPRLRRVARAPSAAGVVRAPGCAGVEAADAWPARRVRAGARLTSPAGRPLLPPGRRRPTRPDRPPGRPPAADRRRGRPPPPTAAARRTAGRRSRRVPRRARRRRSRRCPRRARARRGPRAGGPSPSPARRRRPTGGPASRRAWAPVWAARRPPSNRRCRSTSPRRRRRRRRRRSSSIESAPGQRRVGVGEALADVAEPGRAEQRLGDGVGDGVAVAVADEPGRARGTGTRRARAAGRGRRRRGGRRTPGRRGPRGVTCATARRRASGGPSRGRRASVILRFHGSPGTVTTRPPSALDERGVVGAVGARRRGPGAGRRRGTPAASARRRASRGRAWRRRRRRRRRP